MTRRVFEAAWEHVSAIESPEAVLEDYARYLTSDGLVRSQYGQLSSAIMNISKLVTAISPCRRSFHFKD